MLLADSIPKISAETTITIEKVDFKPGETGEVRIPVGRMPSDTRLYVNVYVRRSLNPGPTVLIMSGVHGDEVNSIVAVSQLIEEEAFKEVQRGTIIIIPLLNVYGFNNFSRDVPDGKDVNRSFPGVLNGSLASQVAATITKKIMPFVDIAIDLHTGGASRYNYPQVRYYAKDPRCEELAQIFNAHFSIDQALISNSFRKVARDHGIVAIVYEGGESIRLSNKSINEAKRGIKRVVHTLGQIISTDPEVIHENPTIQIKETAWQRAKTSGLFIWSKSAGDFIKKGDVLGVIKDPYGNKSSPTISKYTGYIIGHNNASVVNQGDALFHIGLKYDSNGF